MTQSVLLSEVEKRAKKVEKRKKNVRKGGCKVGVVCYKAEAAADTNEEKSMKYFETSR